jgi:hypothetical protein
MRDGTQRSVADRPARSYLRKLATLDTTLFLIGWRADQVEYPSGVEKDFCVVELVRWRCEGHRARSRSSEARGASRGRHALIEGVSEDVDILAFADETMTNRTRRVSWKRS